MVFLVIYYWFLRHRWAQDILAGTYTFHTTRILLFLGFLARLLLLDALQSDYLFGGFGLRKLFVEQFQHFGASNGV